MWLPDVIIAAATAALTLGREYALHRIKEREKERKEELKRITGAHHG